MGDARERAARAWVGVAEMLGAADSISHRPRRLVDAAREFERVMSDVAVDLADFRSNLAFESRELEAFGALAEDFVLAADGLPVSLDQVHRRGVPLDSRF